MERCRRGAGLRGDLRRSRQKLSRSTGLWSALTPDLLIKLLDEFLGASAQTALTLSHVCQDWRRIILADRYTLTSLKFRTVVLSNTAQQRQEQQEDERLPAVFSGSLSHFNITAHVVRARYLMTLGKTKLAIEHWKVAAKKNHPIAQFHVGISKYEAFDAEEAYLYLKRACKQLLQAASEEDAFLLSREERQETLMHASLILGIIMVDNELEFEPDFSFEKDYSGAITWLKVARDRGSLEAAKVLNSLFRNGQY